MNNLLQRKGKFYIAEDFIKSRPYDVLNHIMPKFLIVKAEYIFMTNTIEYWAYSPLFDVAVKGKEMPEYDIEVTVNDQSSSVKAVKRTY